MGQVVFSQSLNEATAGEVEFSGVGRGAYVVDASVTSGGPVGFRLFAGDAGAGWVEVTPGSNPCGALAAGDASSFTAAAGPWPHFKLTWDAAFAGTVTVTGSR